VRRSPSFSEEHSDLSDDEQVISSEHIAEKETTPRSAQELSTPTTGTPATSTKGTTQQQPEGTNTGYSNTQKSTDPPLIAVTTSEGTVIQVLFYAVHISRRYKARVGHRRILLRFDRAGKLRTHWEL